MRARTIVVAVAAMLLTAGAANADTFGTGANQFTMAFVTINGSATDGYGGQSAGSGFATSNFNHAYRMGTFDVTNDQWNKFTASLGVSVTGADGGYSYNSYWTGTNVPTNDVSWYEAAQFVNWLNTSTGHQPAYKFTGTQGTSNYTFASWSPTDAGYNASDPYRNSNAKYYLPTENEWVKAAYWNGTTLQGYATKNGSAPVAGVDSNYIGVVGQPWAVGSGSQELNGTYDMMGNVWEWIESPYTNGDYGARSLRGVRGGSCNINVNYLASSGRYREYPDYESNGYGFRVASDVPEPASLALLTLGGLAMLRRRK